MCFQVVVAAARRWRSLILIAVGTALIALFVYYVMVNLDQFAQLFHVSVRSVIALIGATVMGTVIGGLVNCLVFRDLQARLSYQDGFILAAVSTLANQLPVSGEIVTAAST